MFDGDEEDVAVVSDGELRNLGETDVVVLLLLDMVFMLVAWFWWCDSFFRGQKMSGVKVVIPMVSHEFWSS